MTSTTPNRHSIFAKYWWLVSLISFLLGTIPAWYPIVKEHYQSDLLVTTKVSLESKNWIEYLTEEYNIPLIEGKRRCRWEPITQMLYIRVANNSSLPIEITDYSVEVEYNNNNIIPHKAYLTPIPIAKPFVIRMNKQKPYLTISPDIFNEVTRRNTINPGRSVEGWMLFNWNTLPNITNKISYYDFTFYDVRGKEIKFRTPAPKPEPRYLSGFRYASMTVFDPQTLEYYELPK